LKIKSILVSQPEPAVFEKSPFYEIATKYGINISFRPFIKVEGVSLKDFRSQRVEILDHSTVIFTSRTTVDHFFRICEEARIMVPETMRYLCNTEAVALYLQKYIVYRKRKIAFVNGSFSDFMALILKYKHERFLLVLSEPHKPEIPATMEKLKLNFDRLILSRTASNDVSDLKIKDYDLLVFYSPSEIATLTATFGMENLPLLGTFGDSTTRSALDAGIPVAVMAPTPEVPSMTRALCLYIDNVHAGRVAEPVTVAEIREYEEFIKSQEAKSTRKYHTREAVNGAAAGSAAKKTASKGMAAPPSATRAKGA